MKCKFFLFKHIVICITALQLFSTLNTFGQDLVGSWKGKLKFGSIFPQELKLSIFYDNTRKIYYGVSSTNGHVINNKELRAIEMVFVGNKGDDSLFYITEIAARKPAHDEVPGTNMVSGVRWYSREWIFFQYQLKISRDNNSSRLKGNWKGKNSRGILQTGDIEFSLSDQNAPAEDNRMALEAINALTITGYDFMSQKGTHSLKEQSGGVFKFRLTNKGPYFYKNIITVFDVVNDPDKTIDFFKFSGSALPISNDVVLDTFQTKENMVGVNAKLNLPVDSLMTAIHISTFNGSPFYTYNHAVPVDGFMKVTSINGPDWNSPRLKIISSFYGINNYRYDIKEQLKKLSDAGDKRAQIWESIFMYSGQAGYNVDEQMSFNTARKNNAFDSICEFAGHGDVEAMYLAAMGYKMKIKGIGTEEFADNLLDKCVKNQFAPAYYAFALKRLFEKKNNDAQYYFDKSIKSGIVIARLQWEDLSSDNLANKMKVYEELAVKNNPDALLRLSELYKTGVGVPVDADKALQLAKAAAAISSNGKLALANLYLENHNITMGAQLKLEAATSGNRDAMFDLAVLYLYGQKKEVLNQKNGIELLKRAAEFGQPQAMSLLGSLYMDGTLIEKNDFNGRFWINQAKAKGVGNGVQEHVNPGNPFMDFLTGILNYRPTQYYQVTDRFDNVIRDGYHDGGPLDYILWGGVYNMFLQSRQQKQEFINDIRLIYKRGNISTYGGLLTSSIKLPFTFKTSTYADSYATGTVTFGTFLRNIDADGAKSNSEYTNVFSRNANIPHGAVMLGTEAGYWTFAGKCRTGIQTTTTANLLIGVNDKDYKNNSGYFDLRLDVFDMDQK